MKALVKSRAERGLWLQEVEEPGIGINDVLIRVHCSGICGTDVHIYQWDEWAQKTIPVPMAIGHEFVGEILEVGSNVSDFHPGDIVSGEGHVVCGRCRNRHRLLIRCRGDCFRGLFWLKNPCCKSALTIVIPPRMSLGWSSSFFLFEVTDHSPTFPAQVRSHSTLSKRTVPRQ